MAVYDLPYEQQVDVLAWYLISGEGLQRVAPSNHAGISRAPAHGFSPSGQSDADHTRKMKSMMVKAGKCTEEAANWWFAKD